MRLTATHWAEAIFSCHLQGSCLAIFYAPDSSLLTPSKICLQTVTKMRHGHEHKGCGGRHGEGHGHFKGHGGKHGWGGHPQMFAFMMPAGPFPGGPGSHVPGPPPPFHGFGHGPHHGPGHHHAHGRFGHGPRCRLMPTLDTDEAYVFIIDAEGVSCIKSCFYLFVLASRRC